MSSFERENPQYCFLPFVPSSHSERIGSYTLDKVVYSIEQRISMKNSNIRLEQLKTNPTDLHIIQYRILICRRKI